MAALSPAGSVTIRHARASDLGALARLAAELGYPAGEAQFARRFAHVAEDSHQQILVAESPAGEVVGWVHVHLARWLVVEPRGEVAGLVVASTRRNHGIGGRLMQAAEAWTRERGGDVLTLRSNILRKDAHRFYERLGYAMTKTSLNFTKEL